MATTKPASTESTEERSRRERAAYFLAREKELEGRMREAVARSREAVRLRVERALGKR